MTFTLASVALVNICFLAPAIATTGWSVDTWQNLVISSYKGGSIWQPSFDNFTISGNDFLDLVAKGPYKDAHIDPNSLFVNGATADIINGYGNASDVAGINNYFDGVRNGMTKDGYNLFGQYLVSRFGGEIKGITSWQDSVIDIKASMGTNGIVVILAERWNQIQVPTNAFGFGAAIYKFFTSWFIGFATGDGGLGLAILYAFMISFFWFFGVHGSNIMAAIFEPIWWMILGINAALVSAGMPKTVNENSGLGIFAKPFFDVFMNIGGSGATLGLLIMTVFLSRRRELKEVAKYALSAGCFNVNEPAIFGYPLVLNPTFITPFIIAPIFGLLIGWVATGPIHIINVVYVAVPWTTPWFIAAILATTSPIAILVAIISFAVTTAIWLPFILLDNKLYYRKLKKTDPTAYEEEMKYLHDKEYRNKVKAEAKAEKNKK